MQLPYQLPVDATALAPVKLQIRTQARRIIEPGAGGESGLLVNRGSYTIYVGDSTVTGNADGIPVPPLGTLVLSTSVERYAIADPAAGANSVDVWLLPAGIGYTPSPAEIAAQIAASPLAVEGTQANQSVASGAKSTVVSSATNGSNVALTTTVITAGAKAIELHALVFDYAATALGNIVQLIRSDTGADLVAPQNGTSGRIAKDFQGATLPVGVNVQTKLTATGGGNTAGCVADLNYTLIG